MNKTLKRFHDVVDRYELSDDKAEQIVFQIFDDLRNRNAFLVFYDAMALDTKEELLRTWMGIVRARLDEQPTAEPQREILRTKQLRALPVVKEIRRLR